ncbi:RNA polymerase sigma factor RpoD/SigA [Flaviaesturariibacter flavus]|uniref:RNA polymerase sigma factor RpoD/SigA n=1 Tax=Flaviaesturariibacter flavus TaxID=2502780 RepID=A0A4R1B2D2_9BACT|nr:RNA polymerase sigma factor RpoD/SigA [Flaviaesturariibacter flavus]
MFTPRKVDRLESYLSEVNRLPMVSAENEALLARSIRNGDPEALQQLVQANLRFVVTVAKQYQHRGLALSDLINEGNLGLIKAAARFDESRGFKFISCAVWWIRQSIAQALSDKGRLARIPSNRIGAGIRVQHMQALLEQEHERLPSTEELAEAMGISVEDVRLAHSVNERVNSLDAPLPGREDATPCDELSSEDERMAADHSLAHTLSLQIELRRSLAGLKERDQLILCAFFGIGHARPHTLREIALSLDMTTERIRQIKDKALQLLRQRNNAVLLRAFL